MRAVRRRPFLTLSLTLPLAGCSKRDGSEAPTPDKSAAMKRLKIAVVPKGTTHEFWKSVHAGAVKAARELDVEIVWKGPLKEDDLKSQVDLVHSFTAQGVSGLVLAPLNDVALGASVKGAVRAGIPVLIFDSDLKGTDHTSFVATDNRAAGGLAGERMGALLGGKGNVIVLRYQEGSASTHHREQGFLEALKKFSDIKVISDNQYGGATTESAYAASENLLLAHGAAAGKVEGVFCPNESTTFGMMLAIEKAGLQKKLKFIGFDASDKLVQAVRSGTIAALVLQNPFKMGYLAVKTMSEHLRGQKVAARIDTGAALVDQANMNTPEMAELLKPDLEAWLGKAR
jgi:ribose transport system substrate-binding protein